MESPPPSSIFEKLIGETITATPSESPEIQLQWKATGFNHLKPSPASSEDCYQVTFVTETHHPQGIYQLQLRVTERCELFCVPGFQPSTGQHTMEITVN